ncbi:MULTISPECIES: DUF3789 domain-containing protein [Dorea]|nr:DUF3789 domain-containing protein [Dorea longicatena]
MQRLLFDFLFFSLGGTVGVIAMCILQAGRQSDRKMMEIRRISVLSRVPQHHGRCPLPLGA